MSNQTRISGLTELNTVIFKDKAGAGVGNKFISLFPGLGYAAGYKVYQDTRSFFSETGQLTPWRGIGSAENIQIRRSASGAGLSGCPLWQGFRAGLWQEDGQGHHAFDGGQVGWTEAGLIV